MVGAMRRGHLATFALITSILCLLINCSTKSDSLRIGVILPLSGDAAFYGESVKHGLDLAAEQLNSRGGVHGAKISLTYEDSKALPAEGVSAFQKLTTLGEVKAVIGDAVSSVTLAFAPLSESKKIIVMSPLSSAPAISQAGDYIFRNVPSDLVNAEAAAEYLIRQKGISKLGMLFINNDFGVGLRDAFSREAKKLGGEVIAAEAYESGSADFRSQLSKISSMGPKGVFMVGYAELAQALIQAKEMNLQETFIGTGLMEDPNFVKTTRNAAEGVYFTQLGYDPNSTDTTVVGFVEGYKRKFGESPNIMAAYGYDALSVLVYAANRSDLSASSIKDQLYGLKAYSGATGLISFDGNGDVIQPMGVKRIENGQFIWVSRPRHN